MRVLPRFRNDVSIILDYDQFNPALAGFDVQYGTRRDFQFCIAPVLVTPYESTSLTGLNRAQTYWIRAREYFSNGSRNPWSQPVAVSTLEGVAPPDDLNIQVRSAFLVPPESVAPIIVTAPVAGYPVSNMVSPSPVAQARFGINGAGQGLIYVETSGASIDTIAILETNIPEGATMTVIHGPTYESVSAGPPSYQADMGSFRCSTGLSGRRGYHGLFRLPAPTTNRFFRFDLNGPRPPKDLFVVTHLVMGKARDAKAYADMTDQVVEYGTLNRLRDGTPDPTAGFRGRRVDFSLAFMEERMHERLFADLGQRVGLIDPVLVVPNSKPGIYLHDRLLYGNLTLSRQTNSNARFTRNLSVDSIINP